MKKTTKRRHTDGWGSGKVVVIGVRAGGGGAARARSGRQRRRGRAMCRGLPIAIQVLNQSTRNEIINLKLYEVLCNI